MVRAAAVLTYGCQMNVYDGGRFAQILAEAGYALTDDPAEAGLIIVNTCAVRAHAEERVLGRLAELSGLRARRPDLVLVVAGCVAKEHGAALLARCNAVVYPEAVDDFAAALPSLTAQSRVVLDGGGGQSFAHLPVARGVHHFITVMTGCSNHCAYCIVPQVRGPERSRPVADIVAEARAALAAGVRELTLIGQNVNAYGKDRGDGTSFPALLRAVGALPGLQRLRFVTSHPRDADDALIAAMAEVPTVMPALHLPAQAGSDRVLAAMGRGYTAAQYLDLVARLRARVPGVALASDFIVGFPGEADDDFAATLALARAVGFAQGFVFKFSPRPGTRAATLPGRVPDAVVAARHRELLALLDAQARAWAAKFAGQAVEVLVEQAADGTVRGRTRENSGVIATGDGLVGTVARVHVTHSRNRVLHGRVIG